MLWEILSVVMMFEFVFLLFGLFFIAVLYSSVGHGGASGYLAVLSLTSYGMLESDWLKQHAWVLNVFVAGIAFVYYQKAGFHNLKTTLPFIVASIPMAFIGGYISLDDFYYDILLSLVLLWAAWKLMDKNQYKSIKEGDLNFKKALPWGGGIGFFSGMIGVGGGIFLSPILLLKGWATPKTAAATSALFIWVNSLSGLMGSTFAGNLDIDLEIIPYFIGSVLLGGLIGSYYGSKIANEHSVKKILVVVLIIAGLKRMIELIF
ncbi:MAG: hypothetical protein CMA92_03190 [Euryarchaeota archaeon]|nr:hypothetical protein [Euryarchaeota archaeon]|tara:strand:+ start:288 stop:1073 length:786 start_codon:yes stop_codon:yes gene_type:complete